MRKNTYLFAILTFCASFLVTEIWTAVITQRSLVAAQQKQLQDAADAAHRALQLRFLVRALEARAAAAGAADHFRAHSEGDFILVRYVDKSNTVISCRIQIRYFKDGQQPPMIYLYPNSGQVRLFIIDGLFIDSPSGWLLNTTCIKLDIIIQEVISNSFK